MIRHGVAPFLECSSKGDTRFSSSYALIGKKTISELYNNKRAWADEEKLLTWDKAGISEKDAEIECDKYYRELWKKYLSEHKDLKQILINATGLSNVYGEMMRLCQATVLWSIRKEYLEKEIKEENVPVKVEIEVVPEDEVIVAKLVNLEPMDKKNIFNQTEFNIEE